MKGQYTICISQSQFVVFNFDPQHNLLAVVTHVKPLFLPSAMNHGEQK